MEIKLKELAVNVAALQRWYDPEHCRKDIDPKKLYLVEYFGTWLIGRFQLLTYDPKRPRWIFNPNLGAVSPQIENLTRIVEISEGLIQETAGDTASHILGYLSKMDDDNAD